MVYKVFIFLRINTEQYENVGTHKKNQFLIFIHIYHSISSQFCGDVAFWRRVTDPTTGQLKGFAFCDFKSPEGVLRALRLLNGLELDEHQLLVCYFSVLRICINSSTVESR